METNAYNGFSIKIVRDFYGLNQSQFAKLLGVSQPVISKLEKGDKNLEENQIEKFKEYFEPSFFKRNVENVNQKLFYRKLSSITKTKLALFESRLNLLHNTISEALEIIDLDADGLPKINTDDFIKEKDNEFKIDFEYAIFSLIFIFKQSQYLILHHLGCRIYQYLFLNQQENPHQCL